MKTDLEGYLLCYNTKRLHQGLLMNGRTPYKAFTDGLPKPEKPKRKEVEKKEVAA